MSEGRSYLMVMLDQRLCERNMRLLPLMLLVVCCSASAEWIEIGQTDEAVVFVDNQTIYKIDNNRVRVWEVRNWHQQDTDGAASTKTYLEFDCREKTKSILQISKHSQKFAEGKRLFFYTLNESEQLKLKKYIDHDSSYELILEMFCNK